MSWERSWCFCPGNSLANRRQGLCDLLAEVTAWFFLPSQIAGAFKFVAQFILVPRGLTAGIVIEEDGPGFGLAHAEIMNEFFCHGEGGVMSVLPGNCGRHGRNVGPSPASQRFAIHCVKTKLNDPVSF